MHLTFALMAPIGFTSIMGHAFLISKPRNGPNNESEMTSVFELIILFGDENL